MIQKAMICVLMVAVVGCRPISYSGVIDGLPDESAVLSGVNGHLEFCVGDIIILTNPVDGVVLGMVLGSNPDEKTLKVSTERDMTAVSGTIIKMPTVVTTRAQAGTLLQDGTTAVTVTSTDGFQVGDLVVAMNTTDGVEMGRVEAIVGQNTMRISVHTDTTAAAMRVSKLAGADDLPPKNCP